jgi:glutamate carboxypeptidase
LINSDEEIGSRESTRVIKRLARRADRCFVLEPSLGPDGHLKTARKGVGRFTIRVRGKAAHAGLDPGKGASAILELSLIIQKLFALNDAERGITVNVGTIDGGLSPNVVAPQSEAMVDVRAPTAEDAAHIEQAIHSLKAETPGTEVEVEGAIRRPPMERTPGNQKLWLPARRGAADLGIEIEQAAAGGGSDGNTTSQYAPTLDGLGAVGAGAHAVSEHLVLERMVERSALLARLLSFPPIEEVAR